MVSKRLRKARALQIKAEESEFFRNPANRTHSGRQIIPTFCRPLSGGLSKIERKAKGHTWSKQSKIINNKKVILYKNWGISFSDYVKVNPKMLDKM